MAQCTKRARDGNRRWAAKYTCTHHHNFLMLYRNSHQPPFLSRVVLIDAVRFLGARHQVQVFRLEIVVVSASIFG
eukprot:COSAG02_NODE_13718_length_1357_cov_1.860095_1_plen_74_part_10